MLASGIITHDFSMIVHSSPSINIRDMLYLTQSIPAWEINYVATLAESLGIELEKTTQSAQFDGDGGKLSVDCKAQALTLQSSPSQKPVREGKVQHRERFQVRTRIGRKGSYLSLSMTTRGSWEFLMSSSG